MPALTSEPAAAGGGLVQNVDLTPQVVHLPSPGKWKSLRMAYESVIYQQSLKSQVPSAMMSEQLGMDSCGSGLKSQIAVTGICIYVWKDVSMQLAQFNIELAFLSRRSSAIFRLLTIDRTNTARVVYHGQSDGKEGWRDIKARQSTRAPLSEDRAAKDKASYVGAYIGLP